MFISMLLMSCQVSHSIIKEHVKIQVYTYEHGGETKASAMPELKKESNLTDYKRRFEYLLINVSEIHLPQKSGRRKKIWNLYPDTTKLKQHYLNEYAKDERLVDYFEASNAAIIDSTLETIETYSTDELMEVASKFFYCDKVFPDTTIQTHVCVGLNGVSEANWSKDYTLLEAFCYEGIFYDFNNETSQIYESYSSQRVKACQKHKSSITTLEKYLVDVRKELFSRMKSDSVLKRKLLEYYEKNKMNLAFKIIK